jgi:hypothetical protein
MEKHTIGGLKKILVAATDFYEIADYFMTISETNRPALNGKIGKNKVLKQIVSSIVMQICQIHQLTPKDRPIVLVNMFMIEVRERYFWHGSGLVNGEFIFSFLYFADLDRGMVSVSKGNNNIFARIRTKVSDETDTPMTKASDN